MCLSSLIYRAIKLFVNLQTLGIFVIIFCVDFVGVILERFSFEYHKTKTKAITLTYHRTRRQPDEPIRTRSKYM